MKIIFSGFLTFANVRSLLASVIVLPIPLAVTFGPRLNATSTPLRLITAPQRGEPLTFPFPTVTREAQHHPWYVHMYHIHVYDTSPHFMRCRCLVRIRRRPVATGVTRVVILFGRGVG